MVSKPKFQQSTRATHQLESQGYNYQQAKIVARNHSHSPPEEPRTGMINRLELKQGNTVTHILESQEHQQARIAARDHSHSQTGEPETGIINRLELKQDTTATHFLESQGWV